jgi:hypothetical protein
MYPRVVFNLDFVSSLKLISARLRAFSRDSKIPMSCLAKFWPKSSPTIRFT